MAAAAGDRQTTLARQLQNDNRFVLRVSGLFPGITVETFHNQYADIFAPQHRRPRQVIVDRNHGTTAVVYVEYATMHALIETIETNYSAAHYRTNLFVERVHSMQMDNVAQNL